MVAQGQHIVRLLTNVRNTTFYQIELRFRHTLCYGIVLTLTFLKQNMHIFKEVIEF